MKQIDGNLDEVFIKNLQTIDYIIGNDMKSKILLASIAVIFMPILAQAEESQTLACWYEDQQVEVTTIDCEYEAAFEYYGIPNYNVPPQTSCPTWAIRNVSLEKDITQVTTKIGVGYVPSCGSKWISHDWNGSHSVNGRACDYWWREGKNTTGYEESRKTEIQTRRVRVCEDIR